MDARKRRPDEAQSKFEHWVLEQGGTATVGQMIGAHQMTVVQWIKRRRNPALVTAKKLIDASKGVLSLEDIIEGTSPW